MIDSSYRFVVAFKRFLRAFQIECRYFEDSSATCGRAEFTFSPIPISINCWNATILFVVFISRNHGILNRKRGFKFAESVIRHIWSNVTRFKRKGTDRGDRTRNGPRYDPGSSMPSIPSYVFHKWHPTSRKRDKKTCLRNQRRESIIFHGIHILAKWNEVLRLPLDFWNKDKPFQNDLLQIWYLNPRIGFQNDQVVTISEEEFLSFVFWHIRMTNGRSVDPLASIFVI